MPETLTEEAVTAIRERLLEQEAATLVRSLRQMGLTLPQAAAWLERMWNQPEQEDDL